ncbi:MAG TPA: DUF4810 domain-containing protein [Anaeromyxobacteraceae bacterium]|nr:DUF4810 domain-containing protein [Anaeromyxobacteraceae bacterium]
MRPHLRNAALAALAAAAVSGCATPSTHYAWGDYDDALYSLYKDPTPAQHQKYVASLKAIILASEQSGRKIPPGIYAEYGYALFEEGNAVDAVAYYRKEMEAWPASQVFMEKMIGVAQRRPRPGPPDGPPPKGPATAVEKATGS